MLLLLRAVARRSTLDGGPMKPRLQAPSAARPRAHGAAGLLVCWSRGASSLVAGGEGASGRVRISVEGCSLPPAFLCGCCCCCCASRLLGARVESETSRPLELSLEGEEERRGASSRDGGMSSKRGFSPSFLYVSLRKED